MRKSGDTLAKKARSVNPARLDQPVAGTHAQAKSRTGSAMILENIEITGFRGIRHLDLALNHTNVLIGENAWGKSTLLDALTLLLSPQAEFYQFTPQDFHFTPGNAGARVQQLQIIFTFRADETPDDPLFAPFWQRGGQSARYLYYCVRARENKGQVVTSREFLDARGAALQQDDADEAARSLIRQHPVLRLRDARFSRRGQHDELAQSARASTLDALAGEVVKLTRDLETRPQQMSDALLRQGLRTMQQLLEHYFLVHNPASTAQTVRVAPEARDGGQGWRYLDKLNRLIADNDSRSRQMILIRMFALLIQARGSKMAPGARPILLIEDPETRLHPIMLSVAWDFLALLPLQKIATTNSGELLSQVPLENVCRLVRETPGVMAWRIGPEGMSAEESRRITFHIRVNRPSALFARCWLLVEGETEIWIINELARQAGYHFAAEGVKVIEFAQAGLKPLLKFARRMGIACYVLTDGDDAGKKYASTTRSQLLRNEAEEDYLTQLPAPDMEHFLYRAGFSDIYHQAAHLPLNVPMNTRRIISKAIQRSSKPELAIAVALAAAERGSQAIPALFSTMFARVIWLARGKAD